MRKKIIDHETMAAQQHSEKHWLDLAQTATVLVTSEDPNFPIESALTSMEGIGWRAHKPGKQIIRIVFDNPPRLHRIRLQFSEADTEQTQEFTLRWSQEDAPLREIVRQQWNFFSQQGSTSEIEDYQVQLEAVSVLELTIVPDLKSAKAVASLAAWRLA